MSALRGSAVDIARLLCSLAPNMPAYRAQLEREIERVGLEAVLHQPVVKQMSLDGVEPARGRVARDPEWTRYGGSQWGGVCGARWVHRTGAVVSHCGHPTALRPYVTSGGPQKFHSLADAQAYALKKGNKS